MYPPFHRIRPESFRFFRMFTESSRGWRGVKKPPSAETESGGERGGARAYTNFRPLPIWYAE